MIEISYSALFGALPIFLGFVLWLINVSMNVGAIKAKVTGKIEHHDKRIGVLEKNVIEHDRRIQRIEDSRGNLDAVKA